MDIIISVATAVVVVLMILGFLIGFLRNWKKSLIRLGIIVACLILSIFLAPVFAGILMNKFVKGMVLTIFGFSLNFEDLVKSVADESFANDLLSTTATTTELANAVMNIVLNVISFFMMFIILCLISWIVYVVVFAIVDRKHKDEKPVRNGQYWGLKTVGGFVGLIGGLVVCFAFLTPVFGAMNICDKFVQTSNSNTASAVSPNNLICGELYYKEDEKIGKVEGYIEKYASFKKKYDKSFVGGFFNFFGVSELGSSTFNYLTNVKSDGLKVNFTDEFVSIINVYNSYKETFVARKFDLADNECIDNLKNLYTLACKSEIVKNYVTEFVPKFSQKWIDGEKFLGIAMPISGTFEDIAKEAIGVFNTNSLTRINDNLFSLLDMIKIANTCGLTTAIRNNENIVDYLRTNRTFVASEVYQLSSTPEMKSALPTMVNEFIEIAHDLVIGGDADYSEYRLTQSEIDALDWLKESNIMQELTNALLDVYEDTKETDDASVLVNHLIKIGYIIDEARESDLLSKPLKPFMISFINSSKINLSEETKTTITDTMNSQWENTEFKFEDMFSAVEEMARIAQNILNDDGNISLDGLGDMLEDILTSENPAATEVKGAVKEILKSDTITQIVGDNKEAQVLTDMLYALVDCDNTEEIRAGIRAGQEIINLVNNNKNDGGLVLEGSSQEEKKESAKQTIENITGSEIVMGMLSDASENNESAIKQITSAIGGDAEILKEAINDPTTNISEENKQILNKLFGN